MAATPVLALVLATTVVLGLRAFAARLPYAAPSARGLHAAPIPRAGGWSIWAGFLPAALLWPPDVPGGLAPWLAPWLALLILSAFDDARPVAVGVRLLVHFAAAAWFSASVLANMASPAWIELPLGMRVAIGIVVTLLVTWSLNLYNFMDGSDALAGLMGVVGFGAYAAGSAFSASPEPAYVALTIAMLPFLVVNLPPARMFMGDVGSIPLGVLAAAFGIAGIVQQHWPGWFPGLVFLPFWSDATVTLARRALRGQRVWEAHRDHYYQRLVRMGAGHRGTLALYGAWMVACAGTALGLLAFAPQAGAAALLAWICIAGAFFAAIDYHWRRHSPTSP